MNHEAIATIKVYLGAGPLGGYQPYGQQDRLEKAFPCDHERRLRNIEKYLGKDHQPASWSGHDLAQEQLAFESMLAEAFPELDGAAVNALACRWSYSWR